MDKYFIHERKYFIYGKKSYRNKNDWTMCTFVNLGSSQKSPQCWWKKVMLEYLKHDTLYVRSTHKNTVSYVVVDATCIQQKQHGWTQCAIMFMINEKRRK